MKTKIILLLLVFSFTGLFAQQKAKLQKVDESGFIEVDEVPVLKTQIKPAYPQIAKLAGIEGTVYLKLLIDEKGNVVKVKVEQGAKEILDNSALQAAKEAKFSPAILNNKPVKVWVILPVAFKLALDKKESPVISPGVQAPSNDEDPDINEFRQAEKFPVMVEPATPFYPDIAKKAGIEGKVFVKVLVDKEGNPKKAVVVKSESELFNYAATEAAMKSKFSPALQEGKPIAVWVVLPYKFTLGGEDQKWVPKSFDTVEEAIKEFNSNIYMFENKQNREAIGSPKNMNFEKIEENINYGDESALYRVTNDKKTGYMFIARKGAKFYRCGAKNLEGIRKYLNDFKEDENKVTLADQEGTEEKLPDLTWVIPSTKPEYPTLAREKKIEGIVSFKVLFNADMSITKIDLIKGADEMLNKEALNFVKKAIKTIIEYFDSVQRKYFKQHPEDVRMPQEIKDAAIIRIDYKLEE